MKNNIYHIVGQAENPVSKMRWPRVIRRPPTRSIIQKCNSFIASSLVPTPHIVNYPRWLAAACCSNARWLWVQRVQCASTRLYQPTVARSSEPHRRGLAAQNGLLCGGQRHSLRKSRNSMIADNTYPDWRLDSDVIGQYRCAICNRSDIKYVFKLICDVYEYIRVNQS